MNYHLLLFSRFLPTTATTTGTQHNRGAVGLWIEERNFVLYLVSRRTTCGVGLSLGRIFPSSVRFSGLALDKRLRLSLEIPN